jgi:hypothetical protein
VLFFGSAGACAVVAAGTMDGEARILDVKGQVMGKTRLPSRARLMKPFAHSAVVANWKGDLVMLSDAGQVSTTVLRPADVPFSVPGDCCWAADAALVGMWSGDLYQIDAGGSHRLLLNHPTGIQVLLADNERIYLVDFSGALVVYQGGKQVWSGQTERVVRGMQHFGDQLVIIGDTRAYQLCLAEWRLTPWPLHMGRVAHAIPVPDAMLVLDAKGRGMLLDKELVVQGEFHVTAGAVPVCTGRRGADTYVAFAYPDNSFALLRNTQVVYTHTEGFLGFDSSVQAVAFQTGIGLQLANGEWLLEQCRNTGS